MSTVYVVVWFDPEVDDSSWSFPYEYTEVFATREAAEASKGSASYAFIEEHEVKA